MEVFLTSAIAWFIAQLIKIIITLITEKKLNFALMVESGGMPSSHTAAVVAASVKVGVMEGISSSIFGISLVLSLVVMYDAVGVRQSVGKQAKALNKLTENLKNLLPIDIDLIKEVCGHNVAQVFFGMILGVIVGFVV